MIDTRIASYTSLYLNLSHLTLFILVLRIIIVIILNCRLTDNSREKKRKHMSHIIIVLLLPTWPYIKWNNNNDRYIILERLSPSISLSISTLTSRCRYVKPLD